MNNNSQYTAKSTLRPAAVAGQFYPSDPVELELMIKSLLNGVEDIPLHSKAIIAPHAGLI